ncbi:MAG TPA: cytochrome c oxidase subunit II [Candidatus Methylomirabilis sp.]|nr:cytochrome c oxidase subunit II [Candidatus Methylomirabilis sp.]
MRRGATVYLYELAWILPSIAIPVGMLAALLVTAFGAGIHVPSVAGQVDPTKVLETAPFDKPGLVQTGPRHYEVRMVAQIWSFTPDEIRVPTGSTVTFVATSKDVIHGLFIPGANVNVMLIPGQIARVTAHFDRPGEFFIACHEYCGIAHHTMGGRVVVETRP